MSADNESKGIDRRDALKRMIWAGTGVIWTLSGGVPKSSQLLGIGAALSGVQVSPQTGPTCRSDVMTLVKTSGSSFFQASPRPEPRWPGTFPNT
jgi:hypothetical protein